MAGRTRVSRERREYRCDQCDFWTGHGLLVGSKILCWRCWSELKPAWVVAEAAHLRRVARELRAQIAETRRRG